MEKIITLEEVSKTFSIKTYKKKYLTNNKPKKLVALNQISFSVEKGEIVGIIGNNGSGKSTLLRIVSGIYKQDSGKVIVKGKIAPLLQIGLGFHNELNAYDNIILSAILIGIEKKEIIRKVQEIIEFAELEEFVDMKLKNYSTGMRMRLAFSISMAIDADIILADEIFSVGDIKFRDKSLREFMSFKEKGKTMILSSHNLFSLSNFCDKIILLDKGELVIAGKPTEVIKKYKEMNIVPIEYNVSKDEELILNSTLIPIIPSKTYQWSFQIKGKKIPEKSGYFGVIYLKNENEIKREIEYFSSSKNGNCVMAIQPPKEANFVRLIYRINSKGTIPGEANIILPPLESNTVEEIS